MEMTVFLFILSLFLLFSLTYFHKYHKSVLVELTARNIVEGVTLAREYALNERKKCTVSFTENSMSVIKENGDIVGRKYSFPERIEVKEKSEGFNPVVMQPDGTSRMAGFIILRDTSGGRETRISLHNITGRCFIEK